MKTNTKLKIAYSATDDHRAATQALMAVNQALLTASTVCRALMHDAGAIGDPEMKKAARRLLRTVVSMKDGPNTALWTDLGTIEARVSAAAAAARADPAAKTD